MDTNNITINEPRPILAQLESFIKAAYANGFGSSEQEKQIRLAFLAGAASYNTLIVLVVKSGEEEGVALLARANKELWDAIDVLRLSQVRSKN